jgi:hypothetical protein
MSFAAKIAALASSGLVLIGGLAASTEKAEAGYHGGGIGLGIAAGVLAGAAVAGTYSQPVYADGYRRCGWIRQYDAYGNYIGRVRTCTY